MPNQTFVNNVGTIFCQKDITSSAILTSDTNVFEVVGNGMIIEEVVVRTDATGLAGGFFFQLKADGVLFYSTAVSGLGASSVKDFKNASVSASKITVPPGAKFITVSSTVGACTGAGVATVTIVARKLDSNAIMNPM